MPWDLKISRLNDLLFSPSRDWQTVVGADLLEQRIMLRLKMRRGSWIFDDTKQLGSNLHFAAAMTQPQALEEIEALVLEALEPINEEITVLAVEARSSATDESAIEVVVEYQRILSPGQMNTPMLENQFLTVTLPMPSGFNP
jgi:phage gp46-like protein